ncbi:MAG: hypothetical protein JNN00_13405 [Chitinophagaceae bacterium]|nr:hypothetical protein [Chitinophagaceae bacterium]
MLKRTTGRLLLTLLVITGLAGTLNNSSLSQRERKQAIQLIKNSRAEIFSSLHGLSERQINYKPAKETLSIGELIMNMVALEIKCSEEIKTSLEKPSESEDRLKIAVTDEQLLANNNYSLCQAVITDNMKKKMWKGPSEALKKFNAMRNNHIKYVRTSTEDLRNHVVSTPAGWIDCYQYYLLLADRSYYVAEKINEIKRSPSFPKK